MLMDYSISASILILLSFSVDAQPAIQQGTNDLKPGGSFNFMDSDGGEIEFRAGYGWLIQQELLLKCRYQFISAEDIGPGEYDYRVQQGNLFTEYQFSNRGIGLPYIGLEVGWRSTKYGSVKESGLFLGSKAGIRFFLNNSVSIDTSISFRFSSDDVFIVDSQATDYTIYPGIGLKAWF